MAKFEHTSCSQCGTDLGPGDHGVSSCCDHGRCQVEARGDECECDRTRADKCKPAAYDAMAAKNIPGNIP